MTGAACLSAMSAYRSGTGLVKVVVPKSLNSIFEIKLTESMTIPVEDQGCGYKSTFFHPPQKTAVLLHKTAND